MSSRTLSAEAELDLLQDEAFSYFLHETNPANGLVIDKTAANWHASIAATGLALAPYPVAVSADFAACRGGRANADHAAFFLEQPARPPTRRDRLSRLFLSFSR